jgi:hypothetical protein
MAQIRKLTNRLCSPAAQVAHHCLVSTSAPKRSMRGVWLAACKFPAGCRRVERAELSLLLRQYGMSVYPNSAPCIRVLIVNDVPSIVALVIDLLTGVLQGFEHDTAADGDQVVPGVGYVQLASDITGREALATGESAQGKVEQATTIRLTVPHTDGANGTYRRERGWSCKL